LWVRPDRRKGAAAGHDGEFELIDFSSVKGRVTHRILWTCAQRWSTRWSNRTTTSAVSRCIDPARLYSNCIPEVKSSPAAARSPRSLRRLFGAIRRVFIVPRTLYCPLKRKSEKRTRPGLSDVCQHTPHKSFYLPMRDRTRDPAGSPQALHASIR